MPKNNNTPPRNLCFWCGEPIVVSPIPKNTRVYEIISGREILVGFCHNFDCIVEDPPEFDTAK